MRGLGVGGGEGGGGALTEHLAPPTEYARRPGATLDCIHVARREVCACPARQIRVATLAGFPVAFVHGVGTRDRIVGRPVSILRDGQRVATGTNVHARVHVCMWVRDWRGCGLRSIHMRACVCVRVRVRQEARLGFAMMPNAKRTLSFSLSLSPSSLPTRAPNSPNGVMRALFAAGRPRVSEVRWLAQRTLDGLRRRPCRVWAGLATRSTSQRRVITSGTWSACCRRLGKEESCGTAGLVAVVEMRGARCEVWVRSVSQC